jgi:hypothetical protein
MRAVSTAITAPVEGACFAKQCIEVLDLFVDAVTIAEWTDHAAATAIRDIEREAGVKLPDHREKIPRSLADSVQQDDARSLSEPPKADDRAVPQGHRSPSVAHPASRMRSLS